MKKSIKFIYEHFLRVVVLLSILVGANLSAQAAVLATGETITFILDDSNINSSDGWNGSPFIYAWDSSNNRLTGDWPGTKIQGKSYTFVAGQTIPAGVIFSAEYDYGGNKGKTADIKQTFEPNTIYTIKLTGSFSGSGTNRIFAHTIEETKKCTDYATTIYFKNTVGWCNVYAYLYDGEYWSDNGSGSKNIKAGPIEMDLCTGSGTDAIYRIDLSDYSLVHSGYISFTEEGQKDYDNFHNTKAAHRGDLCGNNKMFVPSTTSNATKNGTVYYSSGSWETYSGTCDAIAEDEFYGTMMCDANNTTTIFWEKFTFDSTPNGDDSRSEYSVSSEKYTAYVPSNYDYVSGHCTAMRSEGTYAMVINSKNAGCYDNEHGMEDCNCENAGTSRWFRAITGNTVNLDPNIDRSNDGMLLFNCGNGAGCNHDVLYECIVNDICPNTFINFAAYVTAANTGTHGNIDVKAEFRLYNADDETRPLAIRKVDNVPLNSAWQQISAMFNSGSATRVKIQLVNKAPSGQGNDLLLDDITFSVCTPKADLKCSNGNTDITVVAGNTETLTSSLTSGLMRNPYYLWQVQNPLTGAWLNLAPAEQNKTTFTITPDSPTLMYRAIIAPTVNDINKILNDRNSDIPCGMYAITNTVTVNVDLKDLVLTSAISDGDICVDGVDENTLTLTLKNPRLVEAKDVKVKLDNIANLNITKVSGAGNYASGVWTVGNIASNTTATIVLNIKSSTSVSAVTSKVIDVYVNEVDVETYASYANAPAESKKQTTLKLNPVPAAPTVTAYNQCAKSGNVDLSTLASGANLNFYSDAALTTSVASFSASEVVTDKKYYVTQTNASGCTSAAAPISVTVKGVPTLNSVSTDKDAICKDESKAELTYNISGGLAPYTLYIDRKEAGTTTTVNPSDLNANGTYSLQPSSDATYKFTKVVDANGCESTSNKTVSIDVQTLDISVDLIDKTVCIDKQLTYEVLAVGDNVNYKWLESTNGGATFTQVGTNSNRYTTNTFTQNDNKQYYVEVYQNPKVCESKKSAVSKVTVNDCANFDLQYTATTSVCKGEDITLNLSITNNSDNAVSELELLITNIANQNHKSVSGRGSYSHNTGLWNIGNLAKDETASIKITLKGETVVNAITSTAYVSKAGSTDYTISNTVAVASQDITVKAITAAPTVTDYAACSEVGMLNLSEQITSNKYGLTFYTTQTGETTASQANKNTVGTTTYWVSKTEEGKCESPRTKLDITVYPLPIVNISAPRTEINCNSPEATITASGADSYSWTDNKGNPAQSGASIVAKQTGSDETIYTVVGKSEYGCESDPVSVTVKENFVAPTVELKPQLQLNGEPWPTELNCRLRDVPVVADTENTPIPVVKYEWTNSVSTTENADLTTKGTHTVTVTAENGCTATSSIEITENVVTPMLSEEHIGSFSKIETNILNCNDQFIDITPSVSNVSEIGGSVEYFWYKNGGACHYGETLEVDEAGVYKIEAVGANNCASDITITLTSDKVTPAAEIVASANMITCDVPKVELTVKTDIDCEYNWFRTEGDYSAETQTVKVDKGGTYNVFVQSKVNGCITTLDYTLDEKTDKPVVSISALEDKVTCKTNTLTASGANSYVWNTGSTNESIDITTGGTYKVTGKNEYGCEGKAEITLEEDKRVPAINLTADVTTLTCSLEEAELTAEVTNAEASRTYSYVWAKNNVPTTETNSTLVAEEAATYNVTVTDNTNACIAVESIVITENKDYPKVETKSLAAVCLPATVNIADAVVSSNADELKYYSDAALNQEVADTQIEVVENATYYVVGYEVNGNGCVTKPYSIPVTLKSITSKPVVENYDECATEGTVKLSSLVKSDVSKLKFYANETSDTPIEDAFDASAANTTATYWVSNTQNGACESERAEITVNIVGYIDFAIEASETKLPAGKDVTITITENSDTPVENYIWYANGEKVDATDDLSLTEQIYLNTKYEVQAVGRCNSPMKEASVEAIWPTAFTPHNGNSKNDSFADGMEIIVFNRFYTKIFEGPSGWDGTINGTLNDSKDIAVPGVYYYSVKLPNGQVKKGTIEIVKVD